MPTEPRIFPLTDNLRAAMWRADDNPKAVIIYFQAREQEESVSFRLATSAPVLSSFWEMRSLHGGHWLTHSESRGTHHYAIALAEHKFLDQPFIVGLELDTDGDPQDHVIAAETWDKTDAEPQIIYMEFPNVA
jgi:hypothetical protein